MVLAAACSRPLAAGTEENVFVDSYGVTAQVNRTGGIAVSGRMNCKAAVDLWEEQNGRELPADSTVNVGDSWTARQRGAFKQGLVYVGGDQYVNVFTPDGGRRRSRSST